VEGPDAVRAEALRSRRIGTALRRSLARSGVVRHAAAPSFSRQQSYRWNGSTIQRDSSYASALSGRPYMIARGLRCACWYDASATARNASCRMPCSCITRMARMANICAGDISP
jgi:hypothetical protein